MVTIEDAVEVSDCSNSPSRLAPTAQPVPVVLGAALAAGAAPAAGAVPAGSSTKPAFGSADDYEISATIGEGSYGVVLRAVHRDSGRQVAIKRFRDSDAEDETVRKMAQREVRLLKRVQHENVVALLEVYRRKQKLHLVFEFVPKTLVDFLGMDAQRTKLVVWQLLRAIGHCHACGVVHRDVSPKNVLLSSTGVLKLADFGFARTLSDEGGYTDYVGQRAYRPRPRAHAHIERTVQLRHACQLRLTHALRHVRCAPRRRRPPPRAFAVRVHQAGTAPPSF
jgi:serine/threonine-protein kinase RIO1